MEKFHNARTDDQSLVKGKTFFEVNTENAELSDIVSKIEHCDPVATKVEVNLTCGERKALDTLKTLEDIVIKKADKGTLIVRGESF